MRWIFILLVLANFAPALLATNETEGGSKVVKPREQVAGGQAIVLLSDAALPVSTTHLSESGGKSVINDASECLLVGPLGSESTVVRMTQQMQASGGDVQRYSRQTESGRDYWVHLKPQLSARAASRLLEELRAAGIDSFVVPEGPLEGAIAVGVFSYRDNAERQYSRLADLGYEVSIEEMERKVWEYWLLIEKGPTENWGALLEFLDNEQTDQKIVPSPCKTVASDRGFQ